MSVSQLCCDLAGRTVNPRRRSECLLPNVKAQLTCGLSAGRRHAPWYVVQLCWTLCVAQRRLDDELCSRLSDSKYLLTPERTNSEGLQVSKYLLTPGMTNHEGLKKVHFF